MRFGFFAVLALFPGARLPSSAIAAEDRTLRIAAAADLRPVLSELVPAYTKTTGVPVKVFYGASGVLFLQAHHHAPFDLFMSADSFYPARLVKLGDALGKTRRVYAHGVLVLWISKKGAPPAGLSALADPGLGKIALANPRVAPYGRLALRCLKKEGDYPKLEKRVIYGDTVSHVAQYLEGGAAGAGFLPKGMGERVRKDKGGELLTLTEKCAPPIPQSMVVLKRSSHVKDAMSFEAFVTGTNGRALFLKSGFR